VTRAPRRILLVEDDRFQRRAAGGALRHHGFQVATAADGEEALRQAAAHPPPDLVLLDLIMPKLSGFEVLRRLKAEPATAGIPVLVLSNLGQDTDIEQALAAGAVGYVVKADVSLRDLLGRIDAVLDGGA
jgi:CheY-like chemotaxis protein